MKKKTSLKQRTIIYIILFVLPFNILTAAVGAVLIKNAMDSARSSIQSALNIQVTNLDTKIKNTVYFLYDYPTNNEAFINFLSLPDDWHYEFYRNLTGLSFRKDLSLTMAAQYMFLYIENRNDMLIINETSSYTGDGKRLTLTSDDILNYINDASVPNSGWHLVTIEETPFLIIITQNKGGYMGALICLSDLISDIETALEYDNVSVYADTSGDNDFPFGIHCASKSANSKLYLNCDVAQNEIVGNMASIYHIVIYLTILSFLIIPALSIYFNKFVNVPLVNIRNAFSELEKGNDNYQINFCVNSTEFSDTYDSFNRMAEKLKVLHFNAVQEAQQKQQLIVDNLQLQLNYLQLQIRPHFLHNNMNLLYTFIENKQTEAAQDLVLYLSDYFRYMFRKGHTLVLFDRELNLIKRYLAISAMHYPDAFKTSYHIDPILSYLRIPPLLFHSFVENIIQHALTPGKMIHIILYGEYDNELVTFQIADDGNGMHEESVNIINSENFSSIPEGQHVGIKNALLRLKHYYGDSSTITVESSPNNGTIFTITFPYNLTEVSNDETLDGQ